MSVNFHHQNRGQFKPGVHAWRSPKPHWEKQWLIVRYVDQRLSCAEIAADVGCTEENIQFWLKKHQIPRRSISQARAAKHWGVVGTANPMFGKIGSLNPRFIDGSSPERQRMYARGEGRELIRSVLARDGFQCRRCGVPKRGRRSLHVHHVKPWAGNKSLRFDPSNTVTLCRPCHAWVHSRKNPEREFLA